MSMEEGIERAVQLGIRLDDATAVDPLTQGRTPSHVELKVLNYVLECPVEQVQVFGQGNATVRRILLEDPIKREEGHINLDRIVYEDGRRATVIEDTRENGWGTYKIDSANGRTTRIINGKEKSAGLIRRRLLADKLQFLMVKHVNISSL